MNTDISGTVYRSLTVNDRSATIHLVQSARFARRFANLLLAGLVVSIFAMTFLPWQQTSRGTGQVVAFAPQERQQIIQAPAKGIVVRIADGLVEGTKVKKDDFLLELQPFAAGMVEQLNGQLKDLLQKKETSQIKSDAYLQNVTGFTEARDFAVSAASQMVESAKAKLLAKEEQIAGYEAKQLQARLNFERQDALRLKGIKSNKEVEKLRKDLDISKADLLSLQKEIESLKKEVAAKSDEVEEKRRVSQTKIDYARAMQQDALGSVASVQKEIREVRIKLEEMQRLVIRAPRDGTVFRMPIYEQGQTIKQGDSILTLIPDTSQKAVELLVNGNDMPLVQIDQEVRLQFEGWPAVQFAGWPSVAVGTFGGRVASLDPTDNGKGEFRILVTANENENEWPSDRYLRQGVRANGWVMLREVSLGYEVWRQLNGFPKIVADKEPGKAVSKAPKIPK